MSDSISTFLSKFNKIVEESQVFLFITRDSDLQKQACEKLKDLLAQVAVEQESSESTGDEDYSNVLLGCKCVAGALIAEIRMWLLLKEGRADEAWDKLVAAQGGLSGAMRAHKGFAHLGPLIQKLDTVEHVVFPPQVFLSVGMIVKSQICSICGEEYEDCKHVKGRPYMGKFCTVTLIPSQIDHVSLVDSPANKSCRVTKFSAEGGERNRMTWRVELGDNHTQEGTEGLKTQGIIATGATLTE
jgi:hypothetical protein